MESTGNFWLIWLIYLIAGGVFYRIFWRITDFGRPLWLAYVARALAAAVILTPWYANSQEGFFAPALIVILLDAITIGSDSAVRAMVPLALACFCSVVFALVMAFINRNKRLKSTK